MLQTPSGGADTGTAAVDSGLMSIGTVLNVLRDEFPEVTISKIRFLESEGLIEPQRTPSGYRKFSANDVERLGHVLRMQRDHYLPLKVIREYLDALERGEPVRLPSVGRQRDSGEGSCSAGPRRPRPLGSAVPSCWPPPRSVIRNLRSGSLTGSSRRCRTGRTTPRR